MEEIVNENNTSKEFRANEKLNTLIEDLFGLLKPLQRDIEKKFENNRWPLGFVLGSTRSGTTILTQWLASLGEFSYPSNFLTRFAYAPYVGALVQKMIFDDAYDYQDDFYDVNSEINFTSNLGKSKGALAVNEFQHFFRNYMQNFVPKHLSSKEIEDVNFQGIKSGLASIEAAFEKPFITKAAMFKYNLKNLVEAIPKCIIFYIKREILYNMQSLLIARNRYFGNTDSWYGSKPQEYETLKGMDIYHQIAGQVFYTNKKIEEDLNELDDNKKITIVYEEFCSNPKTIFAQIQKKYGSLGVHLKEEYVGPDCFKSTNVIKLKTDEIRKLEIAYENISNHNE